MRKWITWILIAALMSALTLTGNAAQDRLSVKSVTVQPGETVYLKLELTESTVGNTVGVAYEYDDTLLKPLASSSTWAREGLMQDFDAGNSKGVWADVTALDLQGLVCTLAFEVIAEGHFDTRVSCMLIVKNGAEEVGTFTTGATVSTFCDHEYGGWEEMGTLGHTRTCKHCQRKQTQSHKWDDGTTTSIPDKPGMDLTTFTCQTCGATRGFEHPSSQIPTAPTETLPPETEPQFTRPTQPVGSTEPDHTHATLPEFDDLTFPTFPGFDDTPSVPTFPNETHSTIPTQGDHGHEHPTVPVQDDHGHDHTTTGSKTQNDNMLVLLATVAVLGGLAWLFVKKKRK